MSGAFGGVDILSTEHVHVAIVGGGITGLSAAWRLRRREPTLRIALLESAARWGGKIQTDQVDAPGGRFVVESGADAFLTTKPAALELAHELGLGDRLLPTRPTRRSVYVLVNGRLTPLPPGLSLIAPTRWRPFLASPLLTWRGKVRVALEPLIRPRRDEGDESLAEFTRRRLGREALARLAEPLMAGIYSANPEEQSMLATFPRYRALERGHGSVIRGLRAGRANRATPGGAPFVSFHDGMSELIDALVTGVASIGQSDTTVLRLERLTDRYRLTLDDGRVLTAAAVVLTVPARTAARLVADVSPAAATLLATLRTASTGVMTMAYRRADIPHPLDATGVVIPRREKRPINAMTWTTSKFAHRAPDGYALLRVFFGGARTPETMALDDDALATAVAGEARRLLGVSAQPIWQRIARWYDAAPQYDVGHLDRVTAIEAALPAGLFVAGSPYRGVGIPDCVRQGEEAANRAVRAIESHQHSNEEIIRV